MKSLAIAAVAALATSAYAACPNACSNHGTCTSSDVCVCYDNWTGADCSERKCAEDRAWAIDASDPHAYKECSGQGVCNRATGECECFDGFTGRACARSACPNDCSGKGKCKLLSEVKTDVPYAGSNWDANRIQTCECDAGYFGPDCSLRKCPTGDDPLTLCPSDDLKNHIQEVRFTLGSATKHTPTNINLVASGTTYTNANTEMALFNPSTQSVGGTGYKGANSANALKDDGTNLVVNGNQVTVLKPQGHLRLSYADNAGGLFSGYPVAVDLRDAAAAPNAESPSSDVLAAQALEIALETLPNKKVNDVKVVSKSTAILTDVVNGVYVPQRAWTVTFLGDKTNSNNVGEQNALQCDSGYSCTEDGCQPKVTMPFLYRYGSTDSVAADSTTLSTGAVSDVKFYTGNAETSADWTNKNYIRLNVDSQPQLPKGVAVDVEATRPGATDFKRYDIRVLVAVVDGDQTNGSDDTTDAYYTKVVFGHSAITSATEKVGNVQGVWKSVTGGATNFDGFSLDGFTFNGPIPGTGSKVAVPGAPGVFIDFPDKNMVANGKGRWFEILVKLPHCTVTPVTKTGPAVKDLSSGTVFAPVDANVENIECSGRGQCNRKSGQCECYSGYYGNACSKQTILV